MAVSHSPQQCHAKEDTKKSRAGPAWVAGKGCAIIPITCRESLLALQGPDFLLGQDRETLPLSILCLLLMTPALQDLKVCFTWLWHLGSAPTLLGEC